MATPMYTTKDANGFTTNLFRPQPYVAPVRTLTAPAATTPSLAAATTSINRSLASVVPVSKSAGTSTTTATTTTQMPQIDVANLVKSIVQANTAAGQVAATVSPTAAITTAKTIDPVLSNRFYENLSKSFPGYQQMFQQMVGNTNNLLQGNIPSDVEAKVRQYAAEFGFQGTAPRTARDLGKTSYDLSQQGFENATKLFDISKNYLTPPTTDISAVAESIRSQIAGASMLSPAQALQAQVELKNLESQTKYQNASLMLEQQKLAASIAQQQAENDMAREVSLANLEYERWRDIQNMEMQQASLQAGTANQSAMLSGWNSRLQSIVSPAAQKDEASKTMLEAGSPQYFRGERVNPGSTYTKPGTTASFASSTGTPFTQSGFTLKPGIQAVITPDGSGKITRK